MNEFYFILINFKTNSHMWVVTITLDSCGQDRNLKESYFQYCSRVYIPTPHPKAFMAQGPSLS